MKRFSLFAFLLTIPAYASVEKKIVNFDIHLEENGKSISKMRAVSKLGEKVELTQGREGGIGYSVELVSIQTKSLVDTTARIRRINGKISEEVLHAQFVGEDNKPVTAEKQVQGQPKLKLTIIPRLE